MKRTNPKEMRTDRMGQCLLLYTFESFESDRNFIMRHSLSPVFFCGAMN